MRSLFTIALLCNIAAILFLFIIASSFTPGGNKDTHLSFAKLPPSTNHVWQNLTPLTGGATVTASVTFASITSSVVTDEKIFNSSCLQLIVTGTNSGSWVVTGPGYKTSNGAAGFQITYTDQNGVSKTVKFSGTFVAAVSPCGS